MDHSSLPGAYGKTRLVLLVVDPHLIHAYWEIARSRLRDVKKKAARGQVVLRFYRGKQDSFDVDIDLQSRNWYVHLWSPEESLYADLAVKMTDGTLIRLARSKAVHLPRTRPVIAIEQHFMKVDAAERHAELVPPPPVEHDTPRPAAAPIDFPSIVTEKLRQVYGSVARRPAIEPEAEPFSEAAPQTTAETSTDLTAIAEEHLTPGLSSGELPDRKK
jgi:hypothetical protein